jgi:hypothetical protein
MGRTRLLAFFSQTCPVTSPVLQPSGITHFLGRKRNGGIFTK